MTLREAREAKRLTPAQLAEKAGVGLSMLKMVEAGKRRLPIDQAVAMAKALGLRDDYHALRHLQGEIRSDACGLIPWHATGGPEVESR